MLLSCQRRWAGSEAIACLVLSALAILLPSDARAGCQSAWVHGDNLSSSWTHLAVLDPGHHWSQSDSAPRETPDRPTPCAGGSCSPSREIPITSPDDGFGRGPTLGRFTSPFPPADPFVCFNRFALEFPSGGYVRQTGRTSSPLIPLSFRIAILRGRLGRGIRRRCVGWMGRRPRGPEPFGPSRLPSFHAPRVRTDSTLSGVRKPPYAMAFGHPGCFDSGDVLRGR